MQIEGKTIIITGGASGLGAETMRYMHGRGANVVACDLNAEEGIALVAELGERAMFAKLDVTSDEEAAAVIAQVVAKFGTVHVCINCAGVAAPSKIIERDGNATSLDAYRRTIDINLVGTFNMLSKCAAQMAKNDLENGEERGVLINVASGAAYEGQIGQAAYASSKNGVIGLNLPAARELGRYGVRVNAIAPGLFGTPMVMSFDQKVIDSLIESCEAPKRVGRMEEFAHACAFLIENAYINGETLRVDAATRLKAR
ncbi:MULTISPECIES: SDR family NAD(P)-dependent oxidoreductase [Rhodobacterales]|nr:MULTISPECIES: SDR family NAD(P)-dependent oxidoreductase [Roseobacteraceae]APE45883.1 3-hydroxyacyl-CoA dehydrogenase [Sulfitobacter alexandrii]MBV7381139.1 SDR family NAD(P)-dependent oxidoreductase [Maritimibacter dapengensis]OWV51227.1 3-hydroxyacyl-CoA dehydrogenase [Mameliella alba]